MEKKEKIAEAELVGKKLFNWYYEETKKITKKYENIPGMDVDSLEHRQLTALFHKKLQELRKKYRLD